ncbi:substrate-binding domain-containing protein [Kitasatospora sp. NPDC088346]|uniref:substrate-binding domain-containing protein n=1 Tax=Kitasatospora sp. NPDC088346 TaxID=3364073 RepID=UPI0037FEA04F
MSISLVRSAAVRSGSGGEGGRPGFGRLTCGWWRCRGLGRLCHESVGALPCICRKIASRWGHVSRLEVQCVTGACPAEATRRYPQPRPVRVARHTDPPLTGVRQPTGEMGRTMARLLLDRVADPGRAAHRVALGAEPVVRGSA